MSFSESGGVITQTGTDTDLSGLSGITGVTITTLGSGPTSIQLYTLASSLRMVVSGNLTIDSEVEQLVCGITPVNGTQTIRVGGTLQVGREFTTNGFNTYSSGTAIRFANDTSDPLFTVVPNYSNLYIESSGVINWYGGKISTVGCFYVDAGGEFNTFSQNAEFVSFPSALQVSRPEAYLRMQTNDTNINGFTNVRGIYLAIGLPGSFLNYNPVTSGSAIDMSASSIPSTYYDYQDLIAGQGNTRDVGGKSNTWVRLLNTNNGSDITVTAQDPLDPNPVQRYLVESKKSLIFNYEDEVGSVIEGAKVYCVDTDNGNRLAANQIGTNVDYVADRIYQGTSDVSGVIDFSAVADAILLSVHWSSSGSGDPIFDIIDYRGNANDSTDLFTFFHRSYGHNPASVTLELKEVGVLDQSQILVTDVNIIASKAVSDAYTELETNQKLYERAKGYWTDNGTNESLYVDINGDFGSYDVVVDATAATAFDLTGNTITIKATRFIGDITTTGTISLVNGAEFTGTFTDSSGTETTISLTFVNLTDATIEIFDHLGVSQQRYTGITGTQIYYTTTGATSPWTYVIDRIGYVRKTEMFDPTGSNLIVDGTLQQLITVTGDVMYTGTTTPLISIDYDFVTPCLCINVGDGVVSPQTVFDMLEDSLVTVNGMRWQNEQGTLGRYAELPNLGESLFLEGSIRLKRANLGDVNAQVSGYVSSTDGIVLDGTNGEVKFALGISAEDIWTYVDRTLTSGGSGLTAQETRDAMLLAPTPGSPGADSIDDKLDDLETQIGALNNISAADVKTQADQALVDYDGPTKTEQDAAFTEIKGAGWTDETLKDIRDNLGTGGTTPADVWAFATRTLTTGTKDTEIDAIKAKTDQLNFTGSDVQSVASNMRGTDGANTVVPDNAGITANGAAIAALNDFDPTSETVTTDTASREASKADVSAIETKAEADIRQAALIAEHNTTQAAIADLEANDITELKNLITQTVDGMLGDAYYDPDAQTLELRSFDTPTTVIATYDVAVINNKLTAKVRQ